MKLSKELRKQIVKFTAFGIIALFADLFIYFIALNLLEEHHFELFTNDQIAKTISFIIGTTITYKLNKKFTWKQTNKSNSRFVKFFVLYSFSLLINVHTNTFSLNTLKDISSYIDIPFKYFFAFLCAATASAVFTFIGQKYWVFKEKNGIAE